MALSTFQIFKIGIGPSSSHTVGPMKAARAFLLDCQKRGLLNADQDQAHSIRIDLYGSLALTGKGHATDTAIMLGLEGLEPETISTTECKSTIEKIRKNNKISLLKSREIEFHEHLNFIFHKTKKLKYHSNGMQFALLNKNYEELFNDFYYSVGGGFIVSEKDIKQEITYSDDEAPKVPFPFQSASELLAHCVKNKMTIAQVMMENEKTWRTEAEIKGKIQAIYQVMKECVNEGCHTEGVLPGPLKLQRRAPRLHKSLSGKLDAGDHSYFLDWVNMWAMAANEQNAAGGKVVTAPTNGACGVIPSVLHYYEKFIADKYPDKIEDFFLTAGAIGILFKLGASISGAEGGCQSEVGTASAMAAAGLAASMNANLKQVESAAEIGMEHHLGLTCDPVGGLVQIPCIERNTMGAVKAINAAKIAMSLNEGGDYKVSLDRIIKVAKKTGEDMKKGYKETSLAGLAAEFKRDVQHEEKLFKQEAHRLAKEKKGTKTVHPIIEKNYITKADNVC